MLRRDLEGRLGGFSEAFNKYCNLEKEAPGGSAVFLLDTEGRLLTVNKAFVSLAGLNREEIEARGGPGSLINPESLPTLRRSLIELRGKGGHGHVCLELVANSDGESGRASPPIVIKAQVEEVGFGIYKGCGVDFTKEHWLATYDDLTGLRNRHGFFLAVEQSLALLTREKQGAVLLFGDFDGLKRINDKLGHSEGDRALVEVANVLRETFRESDIVGRIGGDEFIVLVAGVADEDNAEEVVDRLKENLRTCGEEVDLPLELSWGAGFYNPNDSKSLATFKKLLKRADGAMYEEKKAKPGHRRGNHRLPV